MGNLHQELEQERLEKVLLNMSSHDLLLFALRFAAIEVLKNNDAIRVAYLSAIETNDVLYPDKEEFDNFPESADVTGEMIAKLRSQLEAVHRNLMFEFI